MPFQQGEPTTPVTKGNNASTAGRLGQGLFSVKNLLDGLWFWLLKSIDESTGTGALIH